MADSQEAKSQLGKRPTPPEDGFPPPSSDSSSSSLPLDSPTLDTKRLKRERSPDTCSSPLRTSNNQMHESHEKYHPIQPSTSDWKAHQMPRVPDNTDVLHYLKIKREFLSMKDFFGLDSSKVILESSYAHNVTDFHNIGSQHNKIWKDYIDILKKGLGKLNIRPWVSDGNEPGLSAGKHPYGGYTNANMPSVQRKKVKKNIMKVVREWQDYRQHFIQTAEGSMAVYWEVRKALDAVDGFMDKLQRFLSNQNRIQQGSYEELFTAFCHMAGLHLSSGHCLRPIKKEIRKREVTAKPDLRCYSQVRTVDWKHGDTFPKVKVPMVVKVKSYIQAGVEPKHSVQDTKDSGEKTEETSDRKDPEPKSQSQSTSSLMRRAESAQTSITSMTEPGGESLGKSNTEAKSEGAEDTNTAKSKTMARIDQVLGQAFGDMLLQLLNEDAQCPDIILGMIVQGTEVNLLLLELPAVVRRFITGEIDDTQGCQGTLYYSEGKDYMNKEDRSELLDVIWKLGRCYARA